MCEDRLNEIRSRFESIDQRLLELLAERAVLSRRIGPLKKQMGLPFLQEAVWQRSLKRRLEENTKLDKDYVRRIFELIHEESLRLQAEL